MSMHVYGMRTAVKVEYRIECKWIRIHACRWRQMLHCKYENLWAKQPMIRVHLFESKNHIGIIISIMQVIQICAVHWHRLSMIINRGMVVLMQMIVLCPQHDEIYNFIVTVLVNFPSFKTAKDSIQLFFCLKRFSGSCDNQ